MDLAFLRKKGSCVAPRRRWFLRTNNVVERVISLAGQKARKPCFCIHEWFYTTILWPTSNIAPKSKKKKKVLVYCVYF